jgi:hypothetical protein
MPSQDGLGLYPQSCPGRSRQAITDGGQHHPIGGRPFDPLDLTLEHLDLAPQHQHLSLKFRPVSLARRDRVEEDSQDQSVAATTARDTNGTTPTVSGGVKPST